MIVNIISETVLYPKQFGGMHTAFLNHIQLLKQVDVTVSINSFRKADIIHIHTVGPFALFKLLTSKHVVIHSHFLPETLVGSYRGGRLFKGIIKKYLQFLYNKGELIITFTSSIKKRTSRTWYQDKN